MVFDFYQQRTKDTDDQQIGGFASNFTYDWQMFGSACGMELDYIAGANCTCYVYFTQDLGAAWLLWRCFVLAIVLRWGIELDFAAGACFRAHGISPFLA